MSGRVAPNAERVYLNQGSGKTETYKEFKAEAKETLAIKNQANKLHSSAAEHDKRAAEAQKGIDACNVTINQASKEKAKLEQENITLTARQKKIEEAKLRVLQRKNS